MKLKRFYQYVESKQYDVESVLNHPQHNETFFNMLVGVNYTSEDRFLFSDIFTKNLNSDLVEESIKSEILNFLGNNNIDNQMFLTEGFFDKVKQTWDNVKDKTKEISDKAKEVLGNIIEKAKNAVDFVKKVKDFIVDAFKKLMENSVQKIKEKLKVDQKFSLKVKEIEKADKEGLKKDLVQAQLVGDFYKTKLLNKLLELFQKNAPAALEKGEPAPEDGAQPNTAGEIEVGQKYMYLNSKGNDIEVTVVDDADKDLVQVTSANSKEPFKVKKEKLRNKEGVAAESVLFSSDLKLNENIVGDFIHKIEAIPPFSWLHKVKEMGEAGANAIIAVLSEVTAKLGGPKFVLPVIASLLGLALEYNIKGLAKSGLVDTAAYFTVPFLIPVIKFIGWVATFIAVMIAINDIANMGMLDHGHDASHAGQTEQPAH